MTAAVAAVRRLAASRPLRWLVAGWWLESALSALLGAGRAVEMEWVDRTTFAPAPAQVHLFPVGGEGPARACGADEGESSPVLSRVTCEECLATRRPSTGDG